MQSTSLSLISLKQIFISHYTICYLWVAGRGVRVNQLSQSSASAAVLSESQHITAFLCIELDYCLDFIICNTFWNL